MDCSCRGDNCCRGWRNGDRLLEGWRLAALRHGSDGRGRRCGKDDYRSGRVLLVRYDYN